MNDPAGATDAPPDPGAVWGVVDGFTTDWAVVDSDQNDSPIVP